MPTIFLTMNLILNTIFYILHNFVFNNTKSRFSMKLKKIRLIFSTKTHWPLICQKAMLKCKLLSVFFSQLFSKHIHKTCKVLVTVVLGTKQIKPNNKYILESYLKFTFCAVLSPNEKYLTFLGVSLHKCTLE